MPEIILDGEIRWGESWKINKFFGKLMCSMRLRRGKSITSVFEDQAIEKMGLKVGEMLGGFFDFDRRGGGGGGVWLGGEAGYVRHFYSNCLPKIGETRIGFVYSRPN